MTMADGKCEVCLINAPIGVASTSIPYSVAYCKECAEQGADPESVFEYFYECGYAPKDLIDGFVTFKDGKYISYEEWYGLRNRGDQPKEEAKEIPAKDVPTTDV